MIQNQVFSPYFIRTLRALEWNRKLVFCTPYQGVKGGDDNSNGFR